MPEFRPSSLYFVTIGSAIVGLLAGSETVRWIMAGALAVVAVPLWVNAQRFFQQKFWRDVENIISASDEQRIRDQPADQG